MKEFENAINKKQINKFNLEQLKFLNDLLDGKLTEEQKKKRFKKLWGKGVQLPYSKCLWQKEAMNYGYITRLR